MQKRSWKSLTGPMIQVLWNLVLITLGSWLRTVAINGILIPQRFASGGIVGLALVIHYLFSSLPVSLLYLIFNEGSYLDFLSQTSMR